MHRQTTIICAIDKFDPSGVEGWAIDVLGKTAQIHVLIDQQEIACLSCDLHLKQPPIPSHKQACGYRFPIPERYLDRKTHRLEFRTKGISEPLPFIMNGKQHTFYDFSDVQRPEIDSSIDGVEHGAIKGWVIYGGTGGHSILVTRDDEPIGQVVANRYRPDVANEKSSDAFCGFHFTPPAYFRGSRPRTFRLYVLPDKIELSGSPIVTSFGRDRREAMLVELNELAERTWTAINAMRRQIKILLPRDQYDLGTYEAWAKTYFTDLRRISHNEPTSLIVSIICPTYRPNLAHFTAAVESVIAQTHTNWELIIVDDGSRSPELTAQIEAFCLRDTRVKHIIRSKNGGISAATNEALRIARGEWITFFDHDDLLVDVALEVMLSAAQKTGAKMLYSDEDKIDEAGYLREPAFKCDWNYRLLLANNYVCHLLMVHREPLRQIGKLNNKCDGAQDHDLILRLAEVIPSKHICHVPEVLYHWRKTAGSTASNIDAKHHSIEAGRLAVSDALKRRGLAADVEPIANATFYRICWKQKSQPKVSIIIPFKDESDITRKCLESLRMTRYRNYEIIMVDNWSTTREARKLCEEVAKQPNVRVLRVEEGFNFSRLNNLAARQSDADFLLLLNNDVFHSDSKWLRTMINEALVDPTVAVVGAKLLYPNGYVQHAGVVLGLMGIAGHIHNGLPANAPGYCGKAIVAQELSAVTAACMLIRASVYNELGGLDEVDLPVAFNDVDFCLRARKAGYKVIFTPDVVAEHHESLSRGFDDKPFKESRFFAECQTMEQRWGDVLKSDPFYSRFFDLDGQPHFDLRDLPIT